MKSIFRIELAICASLVFTAQAQATLISWTQFQGDAQHTGHIPVNVSPSRIVQVWSKTSAQLGASSFVSGTVSDGDHIYLTGKLGSSGSYDNYRLFALDPSTGVPAWTQDVTSYAGDVSAPSVSNGIVYVHSWGHSNLLHGTLMDYPKLVGAQTGTGAVIFSTTHTGQSDSGSRPTIAGTQVFAAGGLHGGMDGYDSTTGSKQWFAPVNQQTGWIPAADGNNVYVYMGAASASPGPMISTFFAISRATGTQVYTIQDPSDLSTIYNGTIYLGSQNDALTIEFEGRVVSFDLSTHSIRWHTSGGFTTSMAIDDGLLFVRGEKNVAVLRESDGLTLASWSAPIRIESNILVTENLIFAGTSNKTYAIDRNTMQTVWSTNVAGDLALGDGLLLISNSNGVTAFSVVPEPGTFALAACAILIVGMCVLRRGFQKAPAA